MSEGFLHVVDSKTVITNFSNGLREDGLGRSYNGLQMPSDDNVQFDTTKNCFLAAGGNHVIKFWEMDRDNLLTNCDARGGLPVIPLVCFNKDGTLLAASRRSNEIKILDTILSLQAYPSSYSSQFHESCQGDLNRILCLPFNIF